MVSLPITGEGWGEGLCLSISTPTANTAMQPNATIALRSLFLKCHQLVHFIRKLLRKLLDLIYLCLKSCHKVSVSLIYIRYILYSV